MLPQNIVEKIKKAGDPDARFAASFPETSILFGAGDGGGGMFPSAREALNARDP